MPIFGTQGNDTINGTDADDEIYGIEGDDVIYGGAGEDAIYGGDGDDRLFGQSGRDTIYGGSGNDLLDSGANGGGRLYGGLGDDTYYVYVWNEKFLIADSDRVFENENEGYDRIATTVSYRASGYVEVIEALNFSSTNSMYIHGTSTSNTIIGNAGYNELYGLAGDDILVGGGGADKMVGDGFDTVGNDTYYVDHPNDKVIEGSGGTGIDRIYTSVSYALDAYQEVEFIEADDRSATSALSIQGNEFAQEIVGNAGSNVLRGGAGDDVIRGLAGDDVLVGDDGLDTLFGGSGDDTYYLDDNDVVVEAAGEGADRIATSISYMLSVGSSIEVLEVVTSSSTDDVSLTGNELDNTIIGNAGDNILRGGAGSDRLLGLNGNDLLIGGEIGSTDRDEMAGGAGDDTYYVFSSADRVVELPGEGLADRVATRVNFALEAGAEVERLEAGDSSATFALDLSGSDSGNILTGNAGSNVLNGRAGSDRLIGLGGSDTFVFSNALGTGNIDIIEDMASGVDKIALDSRIFTAFNPGTLDAATFRHGAVAIGADDRILYDDATGALYYDRDGAGGAAAVQFATLTAHLALTASDFSII